ncbi:MAG TPA: hypothetical protein VHN15_00270 [Thermoanaerobaculia bacterium]|nr:hypothetical protein [Thermoanaerobaculia bacterium]
MRALCLGAMLLVLSALSASARDASFLDSLWGEPQGKFGSWSVLVTQNNATQARLYQIVSADLGIVALVSASDEEPMVVRASGHDLRKNLRVRVDRNRPLSLGSGSERSRELLRQMLAGQQIVVESITAEGVRQYHRASLDGFAGAWKKASALVRNLDSAPAYLYEPCDDDQYCLANTFCETGQAYCSPVTQTCQCSDPGPGGGGPPRCTISCGVGQTLNVAACTCECGAVYCEPPQTQDPMTCACGCPDEGCPVPKYWNYGTCTCTCPNGGTICPPYTVWNPDTCECEPRS